MVLDPGQLLQRGHRIADVSGGGIDVLQPLKVGAGLVRQDHTGAGVVVPLPVLHGHRRLGGQGVGVQDLQPVGPEDTGHGVLGPPGLGAALHHFPPYIQGILHKGFHFFLRHRITPFQRTP